MLTALACPRCAAPLPRAARWRTVQCSYCGATVTREGPPPVQRADFRAALARTLATDPLAGTARALRWRGQHLAVLATLARGPGTQVLLAQRLGAARERLVLKIVRGADGVAALRREAGALGQLQALRVPGAAYWTARLPRPIGLGVAEGPGLPDGEGPLEALALHHAPGHWGPLSQLDPRHGLDPRHAVWIWRRLLEVLAFVHGAGWVHGRVGPSHALVHPRGHGVLLIGWSAAHAPRPSERDAAIGNDLSRSAWTLRALLDTARDPAQDGPPGTGARTPAPLARLLTQACDPATAAALGAAGLEQALVQAAREAFGPPRFVPFDPANGGA